MIACAASQPLSAFLNHPTPKFRRRSKNTARMTRAVPAQPAPSAVSAEVRTEPATPRKQNFKE